ncbi:MAG TPA: Rv1535 domain-containing protein [Mycobacterium sp.]|nr:Rv1535 domain-containing protein [Mycobacterium sp.]
MSTTDVLADPITSTLASVLTVPLRQLYALLWRAGVVEIVETDRMSRRAPARAARVAPCPACHHVPIEGSPRPRPRSPQQRLLGPEPTPGDRAGYSRAVG